MFNLLKFTPQAARQFGTRRAVVAAGHRPTSLMAFKAPRLSIYCPSVVSENPEHRGNSGHEANGASLATLKIEIPGAPATYGVIHIHAPPSDNTRHQMGPKSPESSTTSECEASDFPLARITVDMAGAPRTYGVVHIPIPAVPYHKRWIGSQSSESSRVSKRKTSVDFLLPTRKADSSPLSTLMFDPQSSRTPKRQVDDFPLPTLRVQIPGSPVTYGVVPEEEENPAEETPTESTSGTSKKP